MRGSRKARGRTIKRVKAETKKTPRAPVVKNGGRINIGIVTDDIQIRLKTPWTLAT